MQMFRARCSACRWQFDVVVLPLPITIAAGAMGNTCCPMCANRDGNTVGEARALFEVEREHKAKLELRRSIERRDTIICPPASAPDHKIEGTAP